jgi:short-subunit dehydrogenase
VVTGASSGIGRALAAELAAGGVNLVLVARGADTLQRLAAEWTSAHGIECRVVPLDLAVDTGVEPLQAATSDLDVGLLVASAGFGTSGPFLANPLPDELDMLAVNCRSLVALAHHFGNRFAARGQGGLILLSSIVGFQGMPNASHYAATKAYVQVLAEGLYHELRPRGVDVLAAAPGPTNSGFGERAGMKTGGGLKPERIARPILSALGGGTTKLPGLLSKILRWSLLPLPRWAKVRIMGSVMKGMTKHRTATF